MKSLSQLTLLSLLAVALFVPQQSHATFNWKKWTAIGTGVIGVSYIGYKIYESLASSGKSDEKYKNKISLSDNLFNLEDFNKDKKEEEKSNILFSNKTFTPKEYAEYLKELIENKNQQSFTLDRLLKIIKDRGLTEEVLNYQFIENDNEATILQISKKTWAVKIISEFYYGEKIVDLEKENERLEKEIELKIQEQEKLKSGPKKLVVTEIELTRPAIFIGSRYTELNKQYGIEHEIDAFDFTDLCGILLDDNDEKIYVPLRLLSKNYPIWADYFSKNKKEHPNKIINVGSCEIDLNKMSTKGIMIWYRALMEQPHTYSSYDQEELVKRGANFNVTIEQKQINEQEKDIRQLMKEVERLKKDDKTIIIGAIDNDTPLYIGSQHEEINKQYNITKEDQKIVFTDICISGFSWKNSKNKTKFYIPIEQFNAMAIGWSNYYDKTNKEYPHKTIKIGSYELDFNSLKTSYLTQAYNVLSKQTPTFLTEDVDKLLQCGVLKEHPKNLLLNKN